MAKIYVSQKFLLDDNVVLEKLKWKSQTKDQESYGFSMTLEARKQNSERNDF